MESKQAQILPLAIKCLNEKGFVFIQGSGKEELLTEEQFAELDKIAYRLHGFDDMFNAVTFKTVTYISSAEGLQNFLDEDICKRFVKNVTVDELPVTNCTIFTSNPRMSLHLNTTHQRIEAFKAAFIGRKGIRVTELGKRIGYSISLVED